jgi:hypothetical protein
MGENHGRRRIEPTDEWKQIELLRAVERQRIFGSSYGRDRHQRLLFALDDVGWLEALKLDDYSPRGLRRPQMLQQAHSPYHAAWG